MIRCKSTRLAFVVIMLAVACKPALSHIAIGSANSFAAGLAHPLFGIDHILVMVAVGLAAALKGGRASWRGRWRSLALSCGAGLSIVAAVDVPLAAGAVIIGFFALFHGHAHGTEIPETAGGSNISLALPLPQHSCTAQVSAWALWPGRAPPSCAWRARLPPRSASAWW